jgi:hypothetical protein
MRSTRAAGDGIGERSWENRERQRLEKTSSFNSRLEPDRTAGSRVLAEVGAAQVFVGQRAAA